MKVETVLPSLFVGDLAVDDRGEVGFVNSVELSGVKRFYTVTNHRSRFVRAWHGHRREAKYVTVVRGAAVIGVAEIDDWERPSKAARTWRYTLAATKPSVLFIPPGYANGFMSLTHDTTLVFFSTSTFEESQADDVRFPARQWDIWTVEDR